MKAKRKPTILVNALKVYRKLLPPVIVNSEIYGLTHRELVLASFVASLHDGSELSMADWVKYKDILLDEDIDAVKKLGAILRLAECFDHTKGNVIVDISCVMKNNLSF